MTLFPDTPIADTPIFEPGERESLHQYVRPYAAITKSQFGWVVQPLGEYACRAMTNQPAVPWEILQTPASSVLQPRSRAIPN